VPGALFRAAPHLAVTTNVDIPSAAHVPVARSPAVTHERASAAWRLAPVALACAIGLVYLIVQPRTVDLAAAVFRSRLFGEAGFTIWNNSWYSGHPTWSYSVLVPPLSWLLSPALLGVLSGVLAAALFEPLARAHFGARAARWGALWFGAAAMTPVLSGRITFAAGVAAALGALLALQRGRAWLGCTLALACGLLSPIAALFLGLAGVALALSAAPRRRAGIALAVAALATPALVSLLFPDGGEGPFVFSAFWPVPLLALAFWFALPARERTLRIGALLYAAAAVAAWAIATPVGGNAVRLGALVGGPVLLCALLAARRRLTVPLVLLLAGLGVWQWSAAVRDLTQTSGDPATAASFYTPLDAFLGAHPGAYRVEIPFTFSHWETAEVSPRFALARGWLRPDDVEYNHLFYGGRLDAASYHDWLDAHGVRFVAVPVGVKPDYSARAELRLIASRPRYLRAVWGSADWRVYEVARAQPIGVAQLGADDAVVRLRSRGSLVVRVRWSRYWRASDGACVSKAGEWTRVSGRRAGTVRLSQSFSLARVFDDGRRCG
jgi:hypothetical protein